MTDRTEESIRIGDPGEQLRLFGREERFLKKLRDRFQISVASRDGLVRLSGEALRVRQAARALREMRRNGAAAGELTEEAVDRILRRVARGAPPETPEPIRFFDGSRSVLPRGIGQEQLAQAIRAHDVVFCVGPAGTGKTYLAVAMALSALGQGRIRRIVLARPAVEAGEKLGFLPGDLYEKVNPYLRPLYDAMEDLLEPGKAKKLLDRGLVEVVPVAFMRGRTLDRAFVILDEAQNCTVKQMLMFLTRLGPNAQAVVTGDLSQTDLPPSEPSGLADAWQTLRGVPGIAFVELSEEDVQRHPLVQEIVKAYGRRGAPSTPEGFG